ncbi:MAG: outer membrane beta-barrel protein [bacterium]
MGQLRFSIIYLILFLQGQVSAQVCGPVGIKIGALCSDQAFQGAFSIRSTKRIPQVGIAVFAQWFRASRFSLLTQLELAQRGTQVTELIPTAPFEREISHVSLRNKLQYVSMPILLRWSQSSDGLDVYALIGPRIDYLLHYSSQNHYLDGAYADFKRTLLGASIGVGLESERLFPFILLAELRYDFDLFSSTQQYHFIRSDSFGLWLGCGF